MRHDVGKIYVWRTYDHNARTVLRDFVQITRVSQHQTAKAAQEPQLAVAAAAEVHMPGTREPGYIATLKDNYGFITCASAPSMTSAAF